MIAARYPFGRIAGTVAATVVIVLGSIIVASAEVSKQQAIDMQLAKSGYGKLCIDGPNGFPFNVTDDDSPDAHTTAKRLEALGFIAVLKRFPDPVNPAPATIVQYGLTAVGRQHFSTYNKIGWSGEYHGWCYAEYRVDHIVRNTTPTDFMGHRTTDVTYIPRLIHTASWAESIQAKAFPQVAALKSFSSKPLTIGLIQTSDGWEATTTQ